MKETKAKPPSSSQTLFGVECSTLLASCGNERIEKLVAKIKDVLDKDELHPQDAAKLAGNSRSLVPGCSATSAKLCTFVRQTALRPQPTCVVELFSPVRADRVAEPASKTEANGNPVQAVRSSSVHAVRGRVTNLSFLFGERNWLFALKYREKFSRGELRPRHSFSGWKC